MIWRSRRWWRISLGDSARRSAPLYRTWPPVGSMSRSSVRPAVVLPQPLSPTSPSVSPGPTWNEMSSTARTCATTRDRTPFFTGKYFLGFRTSISGPVMSAVHVAGHEVARTQLPKLGFDALALLDRHRAARMELAARREAERV